MPVKCTTCGGSGKQDADGKDGTTRCPDCKGSGEKLTPAERRIAILVLLAIFLLSFVFIWVLRQPG